MVWGGVGGVVREVSKVFFPKMSGAHHALGTGKYPLGFTLKDDKSAV